MNGYQHLIIYYFSGTGNALQASHRIIEKANEKGITNILIPMDRMKYQFL
jgi:flavodoxin